LASSFRDCGIEDNQEELLKRLGDPDRTVQQASVWALAETSAKGLDEHSLDLVFAIFLSELARSGLPSSLLATHWKRLERVGELHLAIVRIGSTSGSRKMLSRLLRTYCEESKTSEALFAGQESFRSYWRHIDVRRRWEYLGIKESPAVSFWERFARFESLTYQRSAMLDFNMLAFHTPWGIDGPVGTVASKLETWVERDILVQELSEMTSATWKVEELAIELLDGLSGTHELNRVKKLIIYALTGESQTVWRSGLSLLGKCEKGLEDAEILKALLRNLGREEHWRRESSWEFLKGRSMV